MANNAPALIVYEAARVPELDPDEVQPDVPQVAANQHDVDENQQAERIQEEEKEEPGHQ